VLFAPVVGDVDDPAVLIPCHLIPLDDPFDRRLAVDDVLIGLQRDFRDRDVAVVDDPGLVPLRPAAFCSAVGPTWLFCGMKLLRTPKRH
jgi:hypothetical protein